VSRHRASRIRSCPCRSASKTRISVPTLRDTLDWVTRLGLIRVAVAVSALLSVAACSSAVFAAVVGDGAGSAVSTTVTATAVRIGDHPAYVRAVVDFAGTTTGANPQVFATDTQPLDGRASLQYVVGPDVQTPAAPQTRFGVSASVIKNARGLGIDLLQHATAVQVPLLRVADPSSPDDRSVEEQTPGKSRRDSPRQRRLSDTRSRKPASRRRGGVCRGQRTRGVRTSAPRGDSRWRWARGHAADGACKLRAMARPAASIVPAPPARNA